MKTGRLALSWVFGGFLALSMTLASCGDGKPPSEVGIRDSLGVRIVQLGSLHTPPTGLRLAPQPEYLTGWFPGEPIFEHPVDGALLPDGRAAIGDSWSGTIVLLSPTGQVEKVLGGKGGGPGEIKTITAVDRLGEDTVVVQDGGNARFSLFHGDSLLRSVPAKHWGRMIGTARQSLIFRTTRFYPRFPEAWLEGVVTRFDLASGRVDTLRSFDMVQNPTDRARFPPAGEVGVTEGFVLVGRSDQPLVEWMTEDGQMAKILKWDAVPPKVTERDWETYEDYFLTDPVTTLGPQARRDVLDQIRPPIGRPLPFFGRLFGDDRGNAWVADYSVNWRTISRFRVFAPDGTWLGSVSLPPRFQVFDIAENRLLGVRFDDQGTAAVTVHRIEW